MTNPPALRFPRGLYGIAPDWADTGRLMVAVQAAIRGGMRALQWRPKKTSHLESLAQGRQLADLCKAAGVTFIVNDSVAVAQQLDADGVHLGRGDGDWCQARATLDAGKGQRKILGCSCYNELTLAQQALDAGADYIAFGAMYASSVKPQAARATVAYLRKAQQLVANHADERGQTARAAVVAIGGITPENAAPLLTAGADAIAVITALFGGEHQATSTEAVDPEAVARACHKLFFQTIPKNGNQTHACQTNYEPKPV